MAQQLTVIVKKDKKIYKISCLFRFIYLFILVHSVNSRLSKGVQ